MFRVHSNVCDAFVRPRGISFRGKRFLLSPMNEPLFSLSLDGPFFGFSGLFDWLTRSLTAESSTFVSSSSTVRLTKTKADESKLVDVLPSVNNRLFTSEPLFPPPPPRPISTGDSWTEQPAFRIGLNN